MKTNFDIQVKELLDKAYEFINSYRNENYLKENTKISIPKDYKKAFFGLVDKVAASLMEDNDNFYGYFLFQMTREIRFDISGPTAVNFQGANYTINFNPIIFLNLNLRQMESSIKHEILHILSMHLIRTKQLKGRYSRLAVNMAMDLVVNQYLKYLPPYATTLEWVNVNYGLKLEPYASFEYYVETLQTAIDLLEHDKDAPHDNDSIADTIETEYSAEKTHDIWEDTSDIDQKTLQDFTEKVIALSEKGELPTYIKNMISSLKNSKEELPWNLYLNRLMGSVESTIKKTITRRNRRQPDRLELRGQLRNHKANIIVALDISGSISDEEFKQAMKEVLAIVKNYNHEITVIECDDQIRRIYPVKSIHDLKERMNTRGSTLFTPVFEYANHHQVNLLVYFTDGKGEDKLKVVPRGYHILWIISGRGDKLSLIEPYGVVKKLSSIEVKDNILDYTDVDRGGFSMQNHENMI
ncbi:hypothetical protein I5677_14765 [Mobilitalea sibirica]|uniref:Metal-dependent peptidase n=1 Tax=Mobilitalea sibirica TaxID=1462919 RepID=A0A8J7KXS1_9FIRM|nr:VWA-like domain-containing protein [Mobilitalea sibirica]MBH1942162.1 hypothetical protein [Mobilitalea sibirica]